MTMLPRGPGEGAEGAKLAKTDFSERDRPTGEDQELHITGKVCAYCGQPITASQTARLAGAGEGYWVHEGCHKPHG